MSKKVYIHIGYPKTASTYLQFNIFDKLHKEGVLDFVWWKRQPKGFVQKLLNLPEWYFPFKEFEESLFENNREINLISEEAIVGSMYYKTINAKSVADKIKRLFPEAKVLIVVRNQADLITSLYKQLIHQGSAISFKSFINYEDGKVNPGYALGNHKLLFESLKYSHLINYYYDLFGASNVEVLNFESLKKDPDQFIRNLLTFMGIPDQIKFDLQSRANKGYGYYQIMIARLLNRFLYSRYNRFGLLQFLPKFFNSNRLRGILQSNAVSGILKRKFVVPDKQIKAIRAYYEEDNQLLIKKYGVIAEEFVEDYVDAPITAAPVKID